MHELKWDFMNCRWHELFLRNMKVLLRNGLENIVALKPLLFQERCQFEELTER